MIKNIQITKLFGSFDYDLHFPDQGEMLILTGPNGYGKTTILNIISSILEGDIISILAIPFSSIKVSYNTGTLLIDAINTGSAKDEIGDSQLSAKRKFELKFTTEINNTRKTVSFGMLDQEKIINARRVVKDSEFDDFEYYSFFQKKKPSLEDKKIENRKILEAMVRKDEQTAFLINFNNTLQDCRMVPSQRLYNILDDSHENSIEKVSEDFKKFLESSYIEFLKISQKRDSAFITTLLDGDETISREEYNSKVNSLKEVIYKAKHYDLLSSFNLPEFRKGKEVILNYFIKEAEQKLATYKKTLAELDLFSDLLEGKRMVNKSINFSRSHGIRFKSDTQEIFIDINKLSSGEKNEIIMLHDFIFNLKEGAILLIDEPEISLHVAWQHEFLDDLEKIARFKKIRVIVATHSPQIIGDRWDLCYDLKEQTEE